MVLPSVYNRTNAHSIVTIASFKFVKKRHIMTSIKHLVAEEQDIREEIEMKVKLMALLKDEEGQGMVEYGLIIALIAVVVLVALGSMGTNIKAVFTDTATKIVVPAAP